MKICPYCAEAIQDAAIVCKHCGRDLGTYVPTAKDLVQRKNARAALGCTGLIVLVVSAFLLWLLHKP